jgi:hypothetical protein
MDSVNLREEFNILVDSQVTIQAEFLGKVTNPILHLAGLAMDIEAADEELSFIRRNNSAEHPDRCRLAGAIRTHESEHLALLYFHGNRVDRTVDPE